MTRHQKLKYQEPDQLRKFFKRLRGQKFTLDCGHHVTFGYYLGNDIMIRNGKDPEIICWSCAY